MTYTLLPLNTSALKPLNQNAYIETTVRNLLSTPIFCGFLGAHGKRLLAYGDSNKKDYHTSLGPLSGLLRGIPGHRYRRMLEHFENAMINKIIRAAENNRQVVTVQVIDTITTTINAGDLVWWDAGTTTVRSVADFGWVTNLPTTQGRFAELFLGVSLDKKVPGDGLLVMRVDISPESYWDFAKTPQARANVATAFAPAQGTGNTLSNTTLTAVPPNIAMARAARPDTGASVTDCLVRVQSAFWGYEWASFEGPQRSF